MAEVVQDGTDSDSEPTASGLSFSLDAVVVASLTFLVCVALSWIPAYWTDEVATINASSKSWVELWSLLKNVDAVHGLYYAFMHVWTGLLGISPFVTRLPSAVACAFAAAAVNIMTARLTNRRAGILAGVSFAVLPVVSQVGMEARGTGFALAAVCWSAVFLEAALTDGKASAWIGYSATLAVAMLFFLEAAMIIVAHGITLLWSAVGANRFRTWLKHVGIASIIVSPLIFLSLGQIGQVSWIREPDIRTVDYAILLDQWFNGDARMATAVLVAATVPLIIRNWGRSKRNDKQAFSVASITVPWIVAPIFIALAISFAFLPVYSARYLFYTAPPIAMLFGISLTLFKPRWIGYAILTLVVILSVRPGVKARDENAKLSTDWSEVGAVIDTNSLPGDGIVFAPDTGVNIEPRRVKDAYPDSFDKPDDIGADIQLQGTEGLWPYGASLDQVLDNLHEYRRIWLVSADTSYPEMSERAKVAIESAGYHFEYVWQGPWDSVRLFEKNAATN